MANRPVKISVFWGSGPHQEAHGKAFAAGLERHGQPFQWFHGEEATGDLIVCWGWAHGKRWRAKGRNVLVMERGHLQPRFEWCSLGFNGLGGLGTYVPCQDDGERFRLHFGHMIRPWRLRPGGYALVIGQVPTDQSLHGINIRSWILERIAEHRKNGQPVLYRQHPLDKTPFDAPAPRHAGTLEDAFLGAAFCETFTSTTAVESVLSGIPAVSSHPGSMAWPVSSRPGELLVMPDRQQWANELAWSQFQLEEMETGFAWEHLKDVLANIGE